MKVLCIGYREWALDIYQKLAQANCCEVIISGMSGKFDYSHAEAINPDLILYGWSSIIPQFILDSFTCLMLHPSRLPEFRGKPTTKSNHPRCK